MSAKCKCAVYLPDSLHREIHKEAKRLGRSVSWVMQRTWKLARKDLLAIPHPDTLLPKVP